MAQLIIDVNDNIAPDVRDTLCRRYNYSGPDTNPAKMAFLKSYVSADLKSDYSAQKEHEASLAAAAAAATAADSADIS